MNNRIPTIYRMKIDDLLQKLEEDFTVGYYDAVEEEIVPRNAPKMPLVYKTSSPKEFEGNKCGLNYDYTEYLAWYFTTYFNTTPFQLFYIELDDGYNYTFFVYQDNRGFHLVIPNNGYLPVDGVVDKRTEEECVDFIVNVLTSKKKANWIVFRYYPTGIYGVPMKQYMDERWIMRNFHSSNVPVEMLQNVFKRMNFVL